ncbi:MAG TPA: MaoC family dehydratase [Terriglobales bacterium]|nr:MaoC family dehydratase [Terriglobales bacterium]
MSSLSFKIGDSASITRPIGDKEVRAFAALFDDYNPLHVDDTYAGRSRFGGRIAHGVICLGLISHLIGMKLPGTGAIYLGQSARFLKPVRVGDTVTASVEVTKVREDKPILTLATRCVNQKGEVVMEGEAVVMVESRIA